MTELADVIQAGRPWHGHQTWGCKLCCYNDTNMERTLEHAEKIHGVFVGVKTVKTSLVGPNGEPLYREVTHGN